MDAEDDFLRPESPLRTVRQPLHDALNSLQVAASAVSTAEPRLAFASLTSGLRFLEEEFLPACRAEESTLFVAVDGLLGIVNSCHVMKSQHTTMMRMAGDLSQAIEAARAEGSLVDYAKYLHPLLYGLYALCRAHLESEDEAYLGLLEAMLSTVQVASLADAYAGALAIPPESA